MVTLLLRVLGAIHSQFLFCKEGRERIAPVAILKRVTERKVMGAIRSWAKKEKSNEKQLKAYTNKFFLRESLVFESNWLESGANHSCCSFFTEDESDSLMVALLS